MRANLFVVLVGILFTCLPSCEQWGSATDFTLSQDNAIVQEGPDVTMTAITAADYGGTPPVLSIACPDDGTKVQAAHIREPVAALLAECDDIRNNAVTGLANKVDRDGDLGMTGAFEINNGALEVNAPGPNGNAITGFGAGIGAGLVGVGGATGPGLTAGSITLPTTTAASVGIWCSGLLQLLGDAPNTDVDPGADNTISPQSINSSSATFDTDGAGNITVPAAGFNVESATIAGDNQTIVVTFKRELLGAEYRFALGEYGPYKVVPTIGARASTGYTFKVWDLAAAGYVNVSTTGVTMFVTTVGY